MAMTILLVGRKKLSSAGSGGRSATAAMPDFCAEHGVTADIELLPSARVNEALDRLRRHDVRSRVLLEAGADPVLRNKELLNLLRHHGAS
ncbi:hypothetical protein ACGFNU_03120 [Spirillospora sp. NPDC048911]|uniref:hypothetical protein n=1 Tax=Spirillospora sp. NPDC048911 TaxID=3364527 RepID=UPI00371C5222